jgi:quinol-cytochrome oxidoreductase complex cytochrome b subunit
MNLFGIREALSRPAQPRRLFFRDLGRLSVFLFGLLAATGLLLALYYRPSPEAAFQSLVELTNGVTFGWYVRSLHRVAAHAFVAIVGLYILRGYFKRLFLGPNGRSAWRISVAFGFVSLAFLLTGEALPWNQHAYWTTVVNANLVAEVPVAGGQLSSALRGGDAVSGATLVRLYAIHALLLPWIAIGLLVLARERRRRGELA